MYSMYHEPQNVGLGLSNLRPSLTKHYLEPQLLFEEVRIWQLYCFISLIVLRMVPAVTPARAFDPRCN
jgi:hypothetical protein